MTLFVSIKDLESQLTELAARVEAGETVVVTREGRPVFDLAPHKSPVSDRGAGQANLERGWAYLKSVGVEDPFPYIAPDFDDPLPEDFLLRPLPAG